MRVPGGGGQLARDGGDGGQFGRREENVSALAQAVWEVSRGGGDDGSLVGHTRLQGEQPGEGEGEGEGEGVGVRCEV